MVHKASGTGNFDIFFVVLVFWLSAIHSCQLAVNNVVYLWHLTTLWQTLSCCLFLIEHLPTMVYISLEFLGQSYSNFHIHLGCGSSWLRRHILERSLLCAPRGLGRLKGAHPTTCVGKLRSILFPVLTIQLQQKEGPLQRKEL